MTTYSLTLFAHILGAIAYFAAVGIVAATLPLLRAARTVSAFYSLARLADAAEKVVPASALVIVVSGVSLVRNGWDWRAGWFMVSLGALALVAPPFALLIGPRVARLRAQAAALADGPTPVALARRAADRLLWSGVALVAAVSVGIVFLMTTKPDLPASLVAMGGALALGLAVALLSSRPLAVAPGGYPPVVDAGERGRGHIQVG